MANTGAPRLDEPGREWNEFSGGPSETDGPATVSGGGARPLRRQRALPSGRALVGGVLVSVAALLTFALAGRDSAAPDTQYVVAAHDLTPGASIEPGDITLQPMSLDQTVAAAAFVDVDELASATLVGPVEAGELLQQSAVITMTEAGSSQPRLTQQLSFELARSRAVDGRLEPGELVDMLATYGTGADAHTSVVLRDAQVVAVDRDGGGSLDLADAVTVTLGLDSDLAVLKATHALDTASVTLVRSTGETQDPPGPDGYGGPEGEVPSDA